MLAAIIALGAAVAAGYVSLVNLPFILSKKWGARPRLING
jgi:hypothetical protein